MAFLQQRFLCSISALPRQAGCLFPRTKGVNLIAQKFLNLDHAISRDELIQRYTDLCPGLNEGAEVVVHLDGSLQSAVTAAVAAEIYGADRVIGIMCPHLSIGRPRLMQETVEKFCYCRKVIPITMAVADLNNELIHSGFPVRSMKLINEVVERIRGLALDVVVSNGYTLMPALMCSIYQAVLLARDFGIEYVDEEIAC